MLFAPQRLLSEETFAVNLSSGRPPRRGTRSGVKTPGRIWPSERRGRPAPDWVNGMTDAARPVFYLELESGPQVVEPTVEAIG